jgi:hypothetical protein
LNTRKTFEEIRQLSRTDMVNIALEKARDHLDFNSANHLIFDKTVVLTDEKTIRVELINPIKYIPYNSEFFYDITIDIVTGAMWYDVYGNPSDHNGGLHTPFFTPTAESENIIQFVIDAINKDAGLSAGESKKSFLENFEGDLIIRDRKDYYAIRRISTYQESWYKIYKKTGEVTDGGHAHLEPSPDIDENPFTEITE